MERERENGSSNGMVKGMLIGLLAGGVIGAGIALLYAPKPGRKLRSDIKEKADSLIEEGQEYIAAVQSKAGEIVDDAKKGLSQLFTTAEKETSKVKESARAAVRH